MGAMVQHARVSVDETAESRGRLPVVKAVRRRKKVSLHVDARRCLSDDVCLSVCLSVCRSAWHSLSLSLARALSLCVCVSACVCAHARARVCESVVL